MTYTVQISTDLVTWDGNYYRITDDDGLVGTDLTVSIPDTEMVDEKLFVRLEVSQ